MEVVLYADGASRGNPGPAAIGVALVDTAGQRLLEISRGIGHTTNNQAEYQALIAGLEAALALGARSVEVRMDSELVVRQMQGHYRVKHPSLQPLAQRAAALLRQFETAKILHIRREANREADRLANRALDEHAI